MTMGGEGGRCSFLHSDYCSVCQGLFLVIIASALILSW